MTTEQTALQLLKFIHSKSTQQTWGTFPSEDWSHWGINLYNSDGFYTQNLIPPVLSKADADIITIMYEVIPLLIDLCEAQSMELKLRKFEHETPMEGPEYLMRIRLASQAVEAARVKLEDICRTL